MQTDIRKRSEKASISRRIFLQFAAAGSAATLPTAALAAADGKHGRHLPPLSDREQVDICVAHLKDILGRMRPEVIEQSHWLQLCGDGSYKLTLWSRVPNIKFDGEGFYHVSEDGYPALYWVERCPDYELSGRLIGGGFICQKWHKGQPLESPKQMWDPYLIHKLDGPHEVAHGLALSAPDKCHSATGEREL